MRIKAVLHYLGLLIIGLGLAMLFPLGWSVYYGEPVSSAFGISAIITAVSGLLLWRLTRGTEGMFSRREALVFVTAGWVLASAFSAIPYELAGTFPNPYNAVVDFKDVSNHEPGMAAMTILNRVFLIMGA